MAQGPQELPSPSSLENGLRPFLFAQTIFKNVQVGIPRGTREYLVNVLRSYNVPEAKIHNTINDGIAAANRAFGRSGIHLDQDIFMNGDVKVDFPVIYRELMERMDSRELYKKVRDDSKKDVLDAVRPHPLLYFFTRSQQFVARCK